MTDILLHHYESSPFSEKVRLVLGHKRVAWRSVIVPSLLPKPDVIALTGGYRRTPFMQIGADVYCDSALVCRVIDERVPEPPLVPEGTVGLADTLAQWADSALFWAAIPFTMQPAGLPHIMAGAMPEQLKAFGADRAAMTAGMRRGTTTDQGAQLHEYLARLEAQLSDGRACLFGNAPSIADFAVVQSIWFMHRAPPIARQLAPYVKLGEWHVRMMAIGHGSVTPLTSDDAIALARASTPLASNAGVGAGFEVGDEVIVTPTDYAADEVSGALVSITGREVVLARDDARAGRVHVHFPRIGFRVQVNRRAASPAPARPTP